MYFIGQLCTSLGLHCEDENMESLAYLHIGAAKVWYVILESYRTSFEEFTARNVFNTSYLTELRAGERLAIKMKYTIIERRVVPST